MMIFFFHSLKHTRFKNTPGQAEVCVVLVETQVGQVSSTQLGVLQHLHENSLLSKSLKYKQL